MGEAMKQIERFSYLGKKFFFNTNTNTPFEVDDLSWDVFEAYQKLPKPAVISSMRGKYDEKEVAGVLDDIDLLLKPPAAETGSKTPDERTLTAWLQISHDCNMRCAYCFAEGGSYHGKRRLMDWRHAKAACDFLLGECENGVDSLVLVFFGGEPLLNFPMIQRVFSYCTRRRRFDEKSMVFTISSNATLLDENMMRYLAENDIGILFSIDGDKAVHDRFRRLEDGRGSHDIALGNGKEFLKYRDSRYILAEATYTRAAFDLRSRVEFLRGCDFAKIKVEAAELRPSHPLAFRLSDVPELDARIQELIVYYRDGILRGEPFHLEPFTMMVRYIHEKNLRKNRCFAGTYDLSISYDGRLYPCTRLAGFREWEIGDVYTGIDGEKAAHWRRTHCYENRASCADCWARHVCGGGCRVDSIEGNGDIRVPEDVRCEIYKCELKASIWLLSEIGESDVKGIL
jgi:uncharacterized protein